MIQFSYLDPINIPNPSYSLQIAEVCLKPLRIVFNRGQTEKKIYPLAIRIFAGISLLVFFPFALGGLALKWWKQKEWQKVAMKPMADKGPFKQEQKVDLTLFSQQKAVMRPIEEIDPLRPDPNVDPSRSNQQFNEKIKKELAKVHHLDLKLGPPENGFWRKYSERMGEYNQTCDDYFEYCDCWGIENGPLVIQRLGTFSQCDLKIIEITADFLKVFHQVPIHYGEKDLTMKKLAGMYLQDWKPFDPKTKEGKELIQTWQTLESNRIADSFPRKNGQYDGEFALDMLQAVLKPEYRKKIDDNCRVIALTNEDLYTPAFANFIFGLASLSSGIGIWSNSRFGNPEASPKNFEKCLFRMMKISAHEFGHIQGIPHCTDYECNIGGYMSLPELDLRPLTYCLQDSAKICSLAKISLLEYHEKLLSFFENFNAKYALNCDFSKEVKTLQSRIAALA